ncbi:MAG: DUF2785 domain-containing protein [Lysobacteraceae bacterium]
MTPVSLLFALMPAAVMPACPPEGTTRESLHALHENPSSLEDSAERTRLALALTACLDVGDPVLRDELGFGLLSNWMRQGVFDVQTLRALRDAGFARLQGEDGEGFGKPFAALLLAEVARTDRIAVWMTPEERNTMVERATGYLRGITDHRGFDATGGWRHGVAHGADWLMQLALNPALDKPQANLMLAAIAQQVMPSRGHAYVAGEYERLARPVLYLASRGFITREEWDAWLAGLSASLGDPTKAWRDTGWIARRHDLYTFLAALNVSLAASTHPALADLRDAVGDTLKTLP